MTGANRVIILDSSWNPSNDQQNIFRIYRLGQHQNCYIYRLLSMVRLNDIFHQYFSLFNDSNHQKGYNGGENLLSSSNKAGHEPSRCG